MASVTIKFEGKPGSGKTLTSRLMSKILHDYGIVRNVKGDTIIFTPYNAERLAKASARPKHWGQLDVEVRKAMIDAANATMNSAFYVNKSLWADLISESNANILLSRLE